MHMNGPRALDQDCAIGRSLSIFGEKWTLLLVRELALGHSRFSEMRDRLGIAPDVLAGRLASLIEAGVAARRSYQDSGARAREEYVLTPAGKELAPVLAGLNEWGSRYMGHAGSSARFIDARTGRRLHAALLDESGHPVSSQDVIAIDSREAATSTAIATTRSQPRLHGKD